MQRVMSASFNEDLSRSSADENVSVGVEVDIVGAGNVVACEGIDANAVVDATDSDAVADGITIAIFVIFDSEAFADE